MKVIDCQCGATLTAANDEELEGQVREHVSSQHPDMQMSDDELRQFVASQSYEASDS